MAPSVPSLALVADTSPSPIDRPCSFARRQQYRIENWRINLLCPVAPPAAEAEAS